MPAPVMSAPLDALVTGVENAIDVAVENMRVIDALFRSAEDGGWEKV